MKQLKNFILESKTKQWTCDEMCSWIIDICEGIDYADTENYTEKQVEEYFSEIVDSLKNFNKKHKSQKFMCYTSTPDYWDFKKNEYIDCEDDDIPECEGPEEFIGIVINDDEIYGKTVDGYQGYNRGEMFNFKFVPMK